MNKAEFSNYIMRDRLPENSPDKALYLGGYNTAKIDIIGSLRQKVNAGIASAVSANMNLKESEECRQWFAGKLDAFYYVLNCLDVIEHEEGNNA